MRTRREYPMKRIHQVANGVVATIANVLNADNLSGTQLTVILVMVPVIIAGFIIAIVS